MSHAMLTLYLECALRCWENTKYVSKCLEDHACLCSDPNYQNVCFSPALLSLFQQLFSNLSQVRVSMHILAVRYCSLRIRSAPRHRSMLRNKQRSLLRRSTHSQSRCSTSPRRRICCWCKIGWVWISCWISDGECYIPSAKRQLPN